MANTLNIEAGDRLTKVCVTRPKGGRRAVPVSFMFPTPEDCVQDGCVTEPEVFATELKRQLASHRVRVKKAVFTVASGRIATREVSLPDTSEKNLKGIILNNASDYFPVDVSGYHMAFSVLERLKVNEEPTARVMVYAAPMPVLEGVVAAASKAGLKLKAIDYAGNSQFRVFSSAVPTGVSMLVDVDCTNTYVTFIKDGKLILQRSFAFGGDELISSYMSAASAAAAPVVAAVSTVRDTESASTAEPESPTRSESGDYTPEPPAPYSGYEAPDASYTGPSFPAPNSFGETETDKGDNASSKEESAPVEETDTSSAVAQAPETEEKSEEKPEEKTEEAPAETPHEELDYLGALDKCCSEDVLNLLSRYDVEEELTRLVSSITRSTDYFRSGHWDTPVENVILSGPCRALHGLLPMVAEGTGLPVSYPEELPFFKGIKSKQSVSPYISCVGSSFAPLELMPPPPDKKKSGDAKKKKEGGRYTAYGALILTLCVLGTGALCAYAIMGYRESEAQKAALEQQIAELSYTRDVYNNYVRFMDDEQALSALDAAIVSPNDSLNEFIRELEQKMPSSILVLSASCTREGVTMNITVPAFEDVAVTLVQLRTFESITDIQIAGVTRTQDDLGQNTVTFSVSCAYGVNPWLNYARDEVTPAEPEDIVTAPDGTVYPSSSTDLSEGDVVDIDV